MRLKLFVVSKAARIFAMVVDPHFGILLWKMKRGFGSGFCAAAAYSKRAGMIELKSRSLKMF